MITDPLYKTFTHWSLMKMARENFDGIMIKSRGKEDLLFNLAGFYGTLLEKIKENAKNKLKC
jgi:hypothetical protein